MCGVVLHRVTASGSFAVFWFVRCGGGGCRVWFWSFPALPDLPDDDCGGLTQAAPKQERDAAGFCRDERHYLSLQLVDNYARTHKKMTKPGKFVEFAGFALILEIRRFFGVCFSFLLRK